MSAALNLPDGAMVALGEKSYLIRDGSAWLWSFEGYTPVADDLTDAELLTPPSIVKAFAAGYRPAFDMSSST